MGAFAAVTAAGDVDELRFFSADEDEEEEEEEAEETEEEEEEEEDEECPPSLGSEGMVLLMSLFSLILDFVTMFQARPVQHKF